CLPVLLEEFFWGPLQFRRHGHRDVVHVIKTAEVFTDLIGHTVQKDEKQSDILWHTRGYLDQNDDLKVDFKEFIALVAMVTSACH
uniref:EF-hand domain-containing protein n=1 Tax=Hippocampus comes TaxID=109280 RepID=A0A3Q3DKJ1_HIPCM